MKMIKLSLVQRNPRRAGGAASSACALGIFSSWHGRRWKKMCISFKKKEEHYLFSRSDRSLRLQGIKIGHIFLPGLNCGNIVSFTDVWL